MFKMKISKASTHIKPQIQKHRAQTHTTALWKAAMLTTIPPTPAASWVFATTPFCQV
jgi:hypothetical protein